MPLGLIRQNASVESEHKSGLPAMTTIHSWLTVILNNSVTYTEQLSSWVLLSIYSKSRLNVFDLAANKNISNFLPHVLLFD